MKLFGMCNSAYQKMRPPIILALNKFSVGINCDENCDKQCESYTHKFNGINGNQYKVFVEIAYLSTIGISIKLNKVSVIFLE